MILCRYSRLDDPVLSLPGPGGFRVDAARAAAAAAAPKGSSPAADGCSLWLKTVWCFLR